MQRLFNNRQELLTLPDLLISFPAFGVVTLFHCTFAFSFISTLRLFVRFVGVLEIAVFVDSSHFVWAFGFLTLPL